MPRKAQHLIVRSKIWLEDDQGHVVFGDGRYRILEAVNRLHSLQKAAKELKMSYRAVWGRIKASEARMGKALVEREGRGSKLTPFAHSIMERYLRLKSGVYEKCDTYTQYFDRTSM